jgi:hypothetical protein
LKPAEERTWQQAFGRYKLGWLGRCWAAAGPLALGIHQTL